MGWRTACFGSEAPVRGQVLATCTFLGGCALVLVGMCVDFVPAAPLRSVPVAVLCAWLGFAGTAWLLMHAHHHGRLGILRGRGLLRLLFLMCAIPVMLAGVAWLVTVKALPWAWTRAFGDEFREPQVMRTHYTRSRRSCDYRLKGGLMEHGFPRHLCIREAFYHRHPEQEVVVVLSGRRSWFGHSIQRIESDG